MFVAGRKRGRIYLLGSPPSWAFRDVIPPWPQSILFGQTGFILLRHASIIAALVNPRFREWSCYSAKLQGPDLSLKLGVPETEILADDSIPDTRFLPQLTKRGVGWLFAGLNASLDELNSCRRVSEDQYFGRL